MASYDIPANLQLPQQPRLQQRGNEQVYAEFVTTYIAIRNLAVALGQLGVDVSGLVPEAPVDGNKYVRKDAGWVTPP